MNSSNKLFGLVFLLMVLIFSGQILISCSTTPTRDRGSLSDAMDKSRDDSEDDRNVPDESREREPEPEWPEGDQQDSGSRDGGPADSRLFTGNSPESFWIGLRGGSTYYSSNDIGTYMDMDIIAGAFVSDHIGFDLYAGFKSAYPVAISNLDASVKDFLLFLKVGIEGKFVPFPKIPFMSPYLFAGLGGYYMFWTFENPLMAGGDEITGDNVGGVLFSLGAGIYPVNLKKVRVGISIIPEIYVFGEKTQEGFNNDYFDYFDTIKIMGEISFKL